MAYIGDILGLSSGYIGVILALYRDNGKKMEINMIRYILRLYWRFCPDLIPCPLVPHKEYSPQDGNRVSASISVF